ncbi:MAG TPA: hypothetical protein DD417_20080 [Elusimicrobia bacterium]|nr:hypothetical protein [Elusimicrobiota bacterium]
MFRNRSKPRDSHFLRLVRIENPDVRRERARAHTTNGLLLYQDASDLEGAERELYIATGLDPESGVAQFHHARFLVLQGRIEEGLAALKIAVKRESDFAQKASAAPEFSDLRRDQRFRKIVEGAPRGER